MGLLREEGQQGHGLTQATAAAAKKSANKHEKEREQLAWLCLEGSMDRNCKGEATRRSKRRELQKAVRSYSVFHNATLPHSHVYLTQVYVVRLLTLSVRVPSNPIRRDLSELPSCKFDTLRSTA